MTEQTVGQGPRPVNQNFHRLRGIPRGRYCKVSWLLHYCNWSRDQWADWKREGLVTDRPEKKTEYVWTDDVIDFLRARSKAKREQTEKG